jgi:N-glycosylase/DNA lyase
MEISIEDIKEAKKVLEYFKRPKTYTNSFYNLCFCILVPQTRFSTVKKVIENLIKQNFHAIKISKEKLLEIISSARYKNRKVEYLLDLKKDLKLVFIFKSLISPKTDIEQRQWFVDNVNGMGYKAASHFLRNMGATDLAIIDTHILKFLKIKGKKYNYLKAEKKFRKIAIKNKLSVAELDAIVWKKYSGTDWKDFVY